MLSLYIKSRSRTIDLVFPAAKFSINLFKFTQSETKRFLFHRKSSWQKKELGLGKIQTLRTKQ